MKLLMTSALLVMLYCAVSSSPLYNPLQEEETNQTSRMSRHLMDLIKEEKEGKHLEPKFDDNSKVLTSKRTRAGKSLGSLLGTALLLDLFDDDSDSRRDYGYDGYGDYGDYGYDTVGQGCDKKDCYREQGVYICECCNCSTCWYC